MTAHAPTLETAGPALWQMRSVRQFAWSVLLWGGFVGLFWLVRTVEPVGGWLVHRDAEARLVQGGPIRTAMLFTGIAHFLIAFYFQWSSPAFQSARSRRLMALFALGGVVLCALFLLGGGGARHTASYFFLAIYFVVHALRDENTFGKRFGDIPPDRLGPGVYLPLLGALACAGLAVTWSFFFVWPEDPGARLIHWAVDPAALAGAAFALWWAVPVVVLGLTAAGLVGYARRGMRTSPWSMVRRYRALLLVYAGILGVCLLGWSTEGGFYAIVLLHVTTWWVFMTMELRRSGLRGSPRQLGLGTWLRRTQAGFQTLHVGLTLLTLVLAAVWIHACGQADDHVLRGFASQEAFRYWTILHISLSFVPRPA